MTRESIENSLKDYKRKEITATDFPGFRRAGVLVLIFPTGESLSVMLTVRTDSVESHKGQISFPGGMMEDGDKDIIDTALRESCEEVGLDAAQVEIIGILDDALVPSKFIITPVLGYIGRRPSPRPSKIEVAEVFEAPLDFFADDGNARTEEREVQGRRIPLWFYNYNGRTIWGATAGILRNLAKLRAQNG